MSQRYLQWLRATRRILVGCCECDLRQAWHCRNMTSQSVTSKMWPFGCGMCRMQPHRHNLADALKYQRFRGRATCPFWEASGYECGETARYLGGLTQYPEAPSQSILQKEPYGSSRSARTDPHQCANSRKPDILGMHQVWPGLAGLIDQSGGSQDNWILLESDAWGCTSQVYRFRVLFKSFWKITIPQGQDQAQGMHAWADFLYATEERNCWGTTRQSPPGNFIPTGFWCSRRCEGGILLSIWNCEMLNHMHLYTPYFCKFTIASFPSTIKSGEIMFKIDLHTFMYQSTQTARRTSSSPSSRHIIGTTFPWQLVSSSSRSSVTSLQADSLLQTLNLVGFKLNVRKSELEPFHNIQFLSIWLCLVLGRAVIPDSKAQEIVAHAYNLSSQSHLSVHQVSTFLGTLNCASGLTLFGQLHQRPLNDTSLWVWATSLLHCTGQTSRPFT